MFATNPEFDPLENVFNFQYHEHEWHKLEMQLRGSYGANTWGFLSNPVGSSVTHFLRYFAVCAYKGTKKALLTNKTKQKGPAPSCQRHSLLLVIMVYCAMVVSVSKVTIGKTTGSNIVNLIVWDASLHQRAHSPVRFASCLHA
jgi:hypothetical protein